METATALDGPRLLSWARRAAAELERRRHEINQLNVFPVPDADTGSNMAQTMAAAVEEASKRSDAQSMQEVAEALAVGAIRGARGNSGVVLSQVIRGVAQTADEDTRSGQFIANALAQAVQFVDRAIAEPVEGTVITVLRAASTAASQALQETGGEAPALSIAQAAADAAQTALARTPSQLEALREAGVVDAGGTGLVILLESLVYELDGQPYEVAQPATHGTSHVISHASGKANLEVMFFFEGDMDVLEGELSTMGDCLVIARNNEHSGKVHIHSTEAGAVIERAFARGTVTQLQLEVLPDEPVTQTPTRLVVAVTPPGSLTDLYAQAGAVTVAPGENIVADILAAVHKTEAREVILLPNGLLDQRSLAAVEKATHAFEQSITLLPTVRLVSGIAALAVHDPAQPLATAAFTMSEAAGEMRTAVLQRAPKAGLVQGGAVSKGDIIAMAHGETLLIADDAIAAVEKTCKRLLEPGGEQVTVLFDTASLRAEDLAALDDKLDVDVIVFPADGLDAVAEIGVE